MSLRTIDMPGRLFTYEDLEDVSDDGNHYELSYGTLVVTPAANTRHQAVMATVVGLLLQHKPPSMRVLPEAELRIRPDLVKRPDVQVVDENLVGGQSIVGTPSLVVEIHSPATRALDQSEKRLVYSEANIAAYWLIDPDALTVTILELADTAYVEVAVLQGEEEVGVSVPFSMTVNARTIFA